MNPNICEALLLSFEMLSKTLVNVSACRTADICQLAYILNYKLVISLGIFPGFCYDQKFVNCLVFGHTISNDFYLSRAHVQMFDLVCSLLTMSNIIARRTDRQTRPQAIGTRCINHRIVNGQMLQGSNKPQTTETP